MPMKKDIGSLLKEEHHHESGGKDKAIRVEDVTDVHIDQSEGCAAHATIVTVQDMSRDTNVEM